MPTYAQICDAVAATLSTVTQLVAVQSYDELTEDYPDTPCAQVYPQSGEVDAAAENNDRMTYGADVRVTDAQYMVDIPCAQRANLAEDMAAVVAVVDAVTAKLEAQTTVLFGLADLKGLRWQWDRMTYSRGGDATAPVLYAGCRFTLWIKCF